MKDVQFEKLKQEVEADLGRPLKVDEEIEVKALYYFGKDLKLKNQLESEPQHTGQILPAVMADIRRRMERQRRHARVISAGGRAEGYGESHGDSYGERQGCIVEAREMSWAGGNSRKSRLPTDERLTVIT